ncbi:MAG: M42 family metallopeptidase [Candidatus Latescibacteria bacterium]|nr:M42 family metallopeptidase [Candidatus Latescibacterota bacterium]
MQEQSRAFLEALVAAPGPSGYEGPVRRVWTAQMQSCADEVRVDVHGNAIAVANPKGRPRVMLAGHMDELGFQVLHLDDKGFIYFDTIGGFDMGIVPGRKVRIHTAKGEVLGVIGKRPIHLMSGEERKKVPEQHELWIDIGAKDIKEARKLVEIGDPITYDANFEALRRELAVSRGFDNKVGAYVVAEVLRQVAQSRKKAKAALYAVATVQEEVGLRGARTSTFGIDPLVGIAVDVTFATDHPGMDKRKTGEVNIGGGPVINRGANVNPVVFERLVSAARKEKIPFQVCAEPGGTGTDANAMQVAGAGVATGLVSLPLRYMHTPVELVSLKDLDHAVSLLAAFVQGIDEHTDFTP